MFKRGDLAVTNSESKSLAMDDRNAEVVDGANDNTRLLASSEHRYAPMPLGGYSKRILDITIASLTLLLASPIMVLIAAMLKLGGGPALFVHRRVGFGGRNFKCYKFRSMVADPEAVLRRHLENNPDAASEWNRNQKLAKDPRVTLFGQMLRLSSLDELPQLYNVLRGDMSCVGPRPVTSEELQRYGANAREYLRTRPGLTGLWQVSGRASVSYKRRIELDSEYVNRWSHWTDLAILFRTVFAVLRFNETS